MQSDHSRDNTGPNARLSTGQAAHKTTLVIACGALAQELIAVIKANAWNHIDIQCLPAQWHNTPALIAPAIEKKILENKKDYTSILVAYGDCGTGGLLDTILEREGVERLPGPHCYSFFAGEETFNHMAADELGTFYLTDYLAQNFDRLILQDLGIEKHPELRDIYFGNYTKLVYLSQQKNDNLIAKAEAAANTLNLDFEVHHTGLQRFEQSLKSIRITNL